MTHDASSCADDFARFREYLYLMARTQVDRQLQSQLDLSGVVQQTLFEAFRAGTQLLATTDEQKVSWLRRILMNNIRDELRRLRADKRDVDREQSLERAIDQSSSRVEAWLVAQQTSPSQQAMRQEESLLLAGALAEVPDDQRRVIELHHFGGLSLAQVAAELGRSKGAIAGLMHRGLKRLRELMTKE